MKVKVLEVLSYLSALPQWLKSICLTNVLSLAIFFVSSLSVKSCSLPLSFPMFFAQTMSSARYVFSPIHCGLFYSNEFNRFSKFELKVAQTSFNT